MAAILTNRRARHDYEILETFEAGLVLLGPEVKSLKAGAGKLDGAHALIKNNEAWLLNMHISAYPKSVAALEPNRTRKLLLRRRELNNLTGRLAEKGLTLIPLEVYSSRGKLKVTLALARGKRTYEKRETIKRRAVEREIHRALRQK